MDMVYHHLAFLHDQKALLDDLYPIPLLQFVQLLVVAPIFSLFPSFLWIYLLVRLASKKNSDNLEKIQIMTFFNIIVLCINNDMTKNKM